VASARLSLLERAPTATLKELLTSTLDLAEALTGSQIGFFHFVDDDQETLWLQAWSTNTVAAMCAAEGAGSHYPIDQAGVWADCVRARKALVHNDYASLPGRKGMPAGHAQVLLGVGNKPSAYDDRDVEDVAALADLAWDIAARKRAEERAQELLARVQEEKDWLRALLDGTQDEVWFADTQGRFTLANTAGRSAFRLEPGSDVGVEELARSLEVLRGDGSPRPVEEAPPLRALRGEVVVNEEEIIRIPATGELRNRQVTSTPVRDRGGTVIGSVSVVRDVTDGRRTMQALRASEQRYRDIVDLSPDAIFVNRADRVVLVNQAALSLFGAERPEQLIGRSPFDLFHPDSHALVRERIGKLLQGSKVPVVRERVLRLDGSTREVDVAAAPFRDDQGIAIQVVLHDVTDQLRREVALGASEAALRIQQSRLDLAVRSGKTGLWDLDLATSQAWRTIQHDRLFGYDELQPSWGPEDALRHVIPEDRSIFRRAFEQALVTGRLHYELRVDPAGGPPRWLEASGEVFRDETGKPVRMAGTVVDISDRKLAEERDRAASAYARSLIEASLDPLVTISPDGKVTDVNAASEAATGVPRDRVVGTDFAEYFTEPGQARAVYQRVLATGSVRDYPLTIRHTSGRTTDVLYNATVYSDPHGKVQGVLATARDVTEVRALQAELALASRLAAMGTLVAGVAHEVNNPLAATLADQEMSLTRAKDLRGRLQGSGPIDREAEIRRLDEMIEELSDAQEGGRRIEQIVKELKLFARPAMDRTRVRLADVVGKALHWLPPLVHKDANLQVEDGGAPDILASFGQIEQVVVNLVTNAAKATRPGTPNLVIIRTCPGAPGMARLEVVDQGTGIEPRAQERIFEPFFTTSDVGRGMGMGLAVCRSIVTSHGGTITVESKVGKGSTFRVELPAAPVDS
jgi:PAS domain S-box-containing protein